MSAIQSRIEAPGPKRALALSGGGTLGVIEIAFLEKIEALLRDRFGKPDLRLCDYFDLIGGTSTGAIIATALALGKSVADVKAFYFGMGPKVFKRPWLSLPYLKPRFDADNLAAILKDILGDRELQTEELRSALAIIAKRIDTGSPWVLTNNPRQKYWEHRYNEKGEIERVGNRFYRLRNVVRASTAAPYYFAPQRMEIFQHAKGDRLEGLFVDGGVSPHNNPAWQLFMLAGIHAYGFNWPLGEDNLLVISVGTGWVRPTIPLKKALSMWSALFAVDALRSLTWDAQMNAIAMLQWMSKPRLGWEINREIGDLSSEFLVGAGKNLLAFQHYDVKLDTAWIKTATGKTMKDEELVALSDFMNPDIMKDAHELATKVAAGQVLPQDFPDRFDPKWLG